MRATIVASFLFVALTAAAAASTAAAAAAAATNALAAPAAPAAPANATNASATSAAAAATPRIANKPFGISNCQVVDCHGMLKEVKFSEEVVEQNMEVRAEMIIEPTVAIEQGSYVQLVLYDKDERVSGMDNILLDVPSPFSYKQFSLILDTVQFPIKPDYLMLGFTANFHTWRSSYYMLNVIVRNHKNIIVMDSKIILDDEATAKGAELFVEEHSIPGGVGRLAEITTDPEYVYADVTIRVDATIEHEVELNEKARWVFDLREGSHPPRVRTVYLKDPIPFEYDALYVEMEAVDLPMEKGKSVFTFFADFRYPGVGDWTMWAELLDEHENSVVRLLFIANVQQ